MEGSCVETEHGVEIDRAPGELSEGGSSYCFVVEIGMPTHFSSHLFHCAHHHLLGAPHRIHLDSEPTRPIVGIGVLAACDDGPVIPATEHIVKMERVHALREHQILPRQQHVQAKRLDVTSVLISTSMKLSPYCGVK